jgi:carbon monoxide dehydrogenase subunit G
VARYVDAIDLPIPVEEAFDYLADFSRTAEWDPGVVEARRLTGEEVRLGSRFRVDASFLGRRVPLEYRIEAFERPRHLIFCGGDSSLRLVDEISFVARPGGTRVTYEARLELLGLRRLADPILDLFFQRIGRLALRGLRERLAESSTEEHTPRAPKNGTARPSGRVRRTTKATPETHFDPAREGAVQ